MNKLLIILPFIFLFPHLYAQNSGFNQNELDALKNYTAQQLENGLSVLNIQNKDSSQIYLRLYTDLPENTDKQYNAFISAEQQIRKNAKLHLPNGWSENSLQKHKLKLSKDDYGYFIQCPMEKLDTAFLLLSQIVKLPLASTSELESAKTAIKKRRDRLLKPANFRIERITKGIIYGKDHPLTSLLPVKDINQLSVKKYQDNYQKFYKPNNSFLVIISPFTADSVFRLSEKIFGEWKKRDVPEKEYKLNKIDETKIVFFDTLASGQYELSMIFPFALHPFTFDFEKSELLSILIQKVLRKKLIDETGLANEITARFQNDKISGNYSLNIKMTQDSVEKAVRLIIESIEALKTGNFLIEDLEQSREELITEFKKQNTDERQISWLIINSEINNLSPNYYAGFIKDISQTSKTGIQSLAGKYLSYRSAIFMVNGKWYPSLNDVIVLSKNYRIELYNLDGSIKRVIPKGFNGFHILNDYIDAVGGTSSISKLKDISIKLTGKYIMNGEEFFIRGEINHKAPNKYYKNISLIRPKKDTLFLNRTVFDGENGMDSTMQGKKLLKGRQLELLKYKSIIIPATSYREWNYKTKILRADTLNGTYVFVVEFSNPAMQKFIDFYDVDKGLRYKRVIEDEAYLNKRTIIYNDYRKIENEDVIYPYFQSIKAKETIIKLIIRDIDTKNRIEKKLFDIK